jgi:hypothetical protein
MKSCLLTVLFVHSTLIWHGKRFQQQIRISSQEIVAVKYNGFNLHNVITKTKEHLYLVQY